jgi:hypothetical protein
MAARYILHQFGNCPNACRRNTRGPFFVRAELALPVKKKCAFPNSFHSEEELLFKSVIEWHLRL